MRLATLIAATAFLAFAVAPALAKPAPHPHAPAPVDPPAGAPGDAAPAAAPAAAGDPTTTDIRCVVVAGAMLGSEDEQIKSVARASLFYFVGRLHGRGDVGDMDARIIDQGTKMTQDDMQAQEKVCIAEFTAANQELENLSNAFERQLGGQPGGGPAPK